MKMSAVIPRPTNSIERGNYSYTLEVQGDFITACSTRWAAVSKTTASSVLPPRRALHWPGESRRTVTKLRASFGKGIKEPAVFDQLESLYALLDQKVHKLISQYHIKLHRSTELQNLRRWHRPIALCWPQAAESHVLS